MKFRNPFNRAPAQEQPVEEPAVEEPELDVEAQAEGHDTEGESAQEQPVEEPAVEESELDVEAQAAEDGAKVEDVRARINNLTPEEDRARHSRRVRARTHEKRMRMLRGGRSTPFG